MTDKTYCLPDGTVLTMPATAAQRLAELEADNARLRAELAEAADRERWLDVQIQLRDEQIECLLPSAATRQALRRAMVDAGWSHSDNAHVWAWLGRLESNDD